MKSYDAVVVGAGPNGLAAAIELARAGQSVLVREAADTVGGGARSMELTLPGFVHDPFSAVHPLAVGSPFLRGLPLADHGLTWIHSPAVLAHPFDSGPPALLDRSLAGTAVLLGADGGRYAELIGPLAADWDRLAEGVLSPVHLSRHPVFLARFGLQALRSAIGLAERKLGRAQAGALFAGSAAHSALPLDRPGSAAFGLVLHAAAHAVGWPIPAGGAGMITKAMTSYLLSLGGEVETAAPVASLDELPPARALLLDLTPRQVVRVGGDYLPAAFRRSLERFRYGMGAFKLDWALSGPIPWRSPDCARAATLHLGGSFDEVVEACAAPWEGKPAERPFVLLAQPSLFDPSRAPPGKHTAWAYCHVPNGFEGDVTDRIEAQVERFAPGFRDLILARRRLGPPELETMNPNLVGGDVNAGAPLLRQILFRPTARRDPYSTPVDGLYICSASTPPGGGVHGMCGYHAARSALRKSLESTRGSDSVLAMLRRRKGS
jgi:phytoene dehydrogenase-like protein